MSLTRSLFFGTVLTSALISGAAQASGVYLLQLGSFEDKGKAQERWDVLQGKYPTLLKDLDVRLMDVTLPPDNFTVYRTQAGALSNRADAQSICDRLSSRGDECYVVETAMFNPSSRNVAAPNPPLSIEGQQSFGLASSSNVAAAPTVTAPAIVAPQVTAPTLSAPQVVAPSVTAPAVTAPSMTAPQVIQPTAVAPAITAPRVTAPALVTPEINAPDIDFETVDPLEPIEEENEGSFWSWLNPFGGDDDIEEESIELVDVDTTAPSVRAPNVTMDAPTLDTDFPELQADMNVPPLVETPTAPAIGSVTMDAPDVAVNLDPQLDIDPSEPFQLPPPPPPTSEQAMAQVMQERAEASRRIGGATMMPRDNMPRSVAPALTGSSTGVDVEEAIQVPVTNQTVPNVPDQRFPTAAEMRAMGMPSTSTPGKSLWAQIYYFSDQQTALGYWDAFRRANPDFPAKRVRVTSPYKATGKQRVALRVGPFANGDDIRQLCLDIETQEIRCGAMADMGASSRSASGPRTLSNRYATRYQTAPRLKHDMYWVQLGSYTSPDQAHADFSKLSIATKPMMDNIQPNIASPIMSSSMEPIYRLRTGPYAMRASADQLCANLRGRGTSCAVTFGK